MKLETGMMRGRGAQGPRDSNAVPREGQLRPFWAGGRWRRSPLQNHPPAGTAGPWVTPGSEALLPTLLLSYWWGWFVCGGFAALLAPLTRLAVRLAPPRGWPPAPCRGAGVAQSCLQTGRDRSGASDGGIGPFAPLSCAWGLLTRGRAVCVWQQVEASPGAVPTLQTRFKAGASSTERHRIYFY